MASIQMTEPALSTVGGIAGWKAIGGGIGLSSMIAAAIAILAAVVVMCMMPPRSAREWFVGIITTVIGSITGGAAAIHYFGLTAWLSTGLGTIALLGIVFACGMPAWALVRWFFTWVNARSDKNIMDILTEIRGQLPLAQK